MLKNDDIPTELNKLSTVETYKIIKEVTVQLAPCVKPHCVLIVPHVHCMAELLLKENEEKWQFTEMVYGLAVDFLHKAEKRGIKNIVRRNDRMIWQPAILTVIWIITKRQ